MGANETKEGPLSYIVPDSGQSGRGPIHRSLGATQKLISYTYEDVKTLYDNFQRGVKLNPNGPCLGIRINNEPIFKWQTYSKVNERVHSFGSGLMGYNLKKGDHVGIFAKNRPEWFIAEHACYSQSLIPVALYDTLGPDAVTYILNHAEISVIVCSQDKIAKILQSATKVPTLKYIIQMEPQGDPNLIRDAESKGITLYSFAEVEDHGVFKKHEPNVPSPDDIATIMYTSGTTGVPKGVILKHSNVIAAISSSASLELDFNKDDIIISYLPMAHIFERVVQGVMLSNGARIAFYSGDVAKLFEDIAILRPTIFPGVPRLFSRMYDKVMQGVNTKGGISKYLFDFAYSSKSKSLDEGINPSGSFWDGLVFSKIREKFGGRLRLIVSGAAPITREVYQFLQIAFSCTVLQGYGLTETCATGSMTLRDNINPGHVGPPLPCVEIRLEDVPEMKYYVTDHPSPRGEVCIRGPTVFVGYYKNKEETEAVFDEDGFFHTGDIGSWNKDGTLSIIDRKKNIFKLAQGEYVAAEYIEGALQKSQYVLQIFVYGDSFQTSLVGIVVPDPDVLLNWAKQNNLEGQNLEALCKNEKVNKLIMDDITKVAKESKLLGFEFVKAISLEHDPFTPENELLTPTYKLKRPQLKEKYKQVIDQLYKNLPTASSN